MVKRGKMLKKVEQLSKISKVPVPGLDEMLASDRIAEFREELAQVEGSDIPIVEIAKAAGCYDLYIGVYATLSSTVHASVHDIEGQVAYSRSEEHTSELQSLMRISYAVFCLTIK